ncbi:hypothetical protein V1512DRAFT_246131 [Lipomyces arxii]|uniref:uncharacterized protein n=1 Tax=Lipomyces arxii TaxID=56418 RepID=UPI0034CD83C1
MTSSLGYRDVETWSRQVIAPPPSLGVRRTATGSSTTSSNRLSASSSTSARQGQHQNTPPLQTSAEGYNYFSNGPYRSMSTAMRMDSTPTSPVSRRSSQDGLYILNKSLSVDDSHPAGSLAVAAAAVSAIAASSSPSPLIDAREFPSQRSASVGRFSVKERDSISEEFPSRRQHRQHSYRSYRTTEMEINGNNSADCAEGSSGSEIIERVKMHRRHRRHHHQHHHKHRHSIDEIAPDDAEVDNEFNERRHSEETSNSRDAESSITTSSDHLPLSSATSPDVASPSDLSRTKMILPFIKEPSPSQSANLRFHTRNETEASSTLHIPLANSRPVSIASAVHHTEIFEDSRTEKSKSARQEEKSPMCCIIM